MCAHDETQLESTNQVGVCVGVWKKHNCQSHGFTMCAHDENSIGEDTNIGHQTYLDRRNKHDGEHTTNLQIPKIDNCAASKFQHKFETEAFINIMYIYLFLYLRQNLIERMK